MTQKDQFKESLLFIGDLIDLQGNHICELEGTLTHELHSPNLIAIKAEITDSKVGGFDQRIGSEENYIIQTREQSNRPKYYLNVTLGKRTLGEVFFKVSEYYTYRDKVIDYKMQHMRFDPDTLKKPTLFFSWIMPEFNEQGWKFKPTEHPHKGLLFEIDSTQLGKTNNIQWFDNLYEIRNPFGEFVVHHSLNYQENKKGFYRVFNVLPELSCHYENESKDFPTEWEVIQGEFNRISNLFIPISYGIKFVNGYRVESYTQSLSYFNPDNKRYVWIKRVNRVRELKSGKRLHSNIYNGQWRFIEDFSNKFIQLNDEDTIRIKRSIDRFSEAIEADYIELKLTLLHSALSILLDVECYDNFDKNNKPEDFPMPTGGVTFRMAKFILEHNLEWRDLIPEGKSQSVLYKFNNLRNKYLKQKTHQIDDYTPIRILHRMFERILITEMGLEFEDYKDALGNF